MLQEHSTLRAGLRLYCRPSAVTAAIVAAVLSAGSAGWAQDSAKAKKKAPAEPAVHFLSSVQVPVTDGNTTNGMYSFDISYVDQSTGVYFLADRSNLAVESLAAESVLTQIRPNNGHAPFAGFTPCAVQPAGANDCAGPNGVVAVFPFLFVTDAPSRVLSFDLRFNPPKTVGDCTTKAGEPTRADELAYDPRDGLILAINNASSPPFGTLVKVDKSTGALTCGMNIPFNAANGVDAQNGAEQPVWDPGTKKFYLSIPQIGSNPTVGGVLRIGTGGK